VILQAPELVKVLIGLAHGMEKIEEVASELYELRGIFDDFRKIQDSIIHLNGTMNDVERNSPIILNETMDDDPNSLITLSVPVDDNYSKLSVSLNSQAGGVMKPSEMSAFHVDEPSFLDTDQSILEILIPTESML